MGGRGIGAYLYELGLGHQGRGSVVEVGSWLGSSCAYVSLGLKDAGSAAPVHCFDRFTYLGEKAELVGHLGLELNQDLVPVFQSYVLPVYSNIHAHKTDILDIRWDGSPVEIYIDDASKKKAQFLHVLKTFGPSFIPGVTTMVLMDFNMYRKENVYAPEKIAQYRCQKDILDSLAGHFRLVESFWPAKSMASFRYEKKFDFGSLNRLHS